MSVRPLLYLVVAFLLGQPALGGCLQYEPAVVELRGVMERQTFPGRPNYESIQAGDEPETYWILVLEKPACVEGAKDDHTNVAESEVKEIQLVLSKDHYEAFASLLGRKVRVGGTLFHSITGHHHSSVLMTVREIEPAA